MAKFTCKKKQITVLDLGGKMEGNGIMEGNS